MPTSLIPFPPKLPKMGVQNEGLFFQLVYTRTSRFGALKASDTKSCNYERASISDLCTIHHQNLEKQADSLYLPLGRQGLAARPGIPGT